jgi:hypothetical protein
MSGFTGGNLPFVLPIKLTRFGPVELLLLVAGSLAKTARKH